MASLAKQRFSLSLTSTASLTATLTNSLAESGTYPGMCKSSPMLLHRLCTQIVPVGMNFGQSGTLPFSKGIPDSISDDVKNAKGALFSNASKQKMVTESAKSSHWDYE